MVQPVLLAVEVLTQPAKIASKRANNACSSKD